MSPTLEEVKMANFREAFELTIGHEGNYSNDPLDPGGETYRGISRRYWPGWTGWAIIDSYSVANIPSEGTNHELDLAVRTFYKDHFWNRFEGDKVPHQDIANELFDTGVNMSMSRAIEFLQEALNLCNRDQKYWKDISVDGSWGPITEDTLLQALSRNQGDLVYKLQNVLQAEFYIHKMRTDTSKERWIGWFNRIDILRR